MNREHLEFGFVVAVDSLGLVVVESDQRIDNPFVSLHEEVQMLPHLVMVNRAEEGRYLFQDHWCLMLMIIIVGDVFV